MVFFSYNQLEEHEGQKNSSRLVVRVTERAMTAAVSGCFCRRSKWKAGGPRITVSTSREKWVLASWILTLRMAVSLLGGD